MKRSDIIRSRIAEELIRHPEVEDPALLSLTIVVKIDSKTGDPGLLLFRPEFERRLPGRPQS